MKFYLFAYEEDCSKGGIEDLYNVYDSFDEAYSSLLKINTTKTYFDCAQIYDEKIVKTYLYVGEWIEESTYT